MLKKALDLIWLAFEKEKDENGVPYFLDAVLTALKMKNESDQTVALLMHILENAAVTVDDLWAEGFSAEIIDAVSALTRREGESFSQNLERIGCNEHSRRVKIAELCQKCDSMRAEVNLGTKKSIKLEKYGYAIEFLENFEDSFADEQQ